MSYPSVHGSSGFATSHAKPSREFLRQNYDWQDDAFKNYTLACQLIGERIMRRRIIAALRHRAAQLPIIEIAEVIE
jgi:hypothetical protein